MNTISNGINCIANLWKEFFSNGINWKDLETGITYERYQAISDKDHLKKIIQMPVHFLQESGKGFFCKEDGAVLALRDDLREVIRNEVFVKQMEDVIAIGRWIIVGGGIGRKWGNKSFFMSYTEEASSEKK